MKHGSLFSGIGGFDLASEWMCWENIFHCEWNEFGKRVLKYYWPKAISYEDITKTDFSVHRGQIDVLTGGFPCQAFSNSGKQLGESDTRYLFPEMLRAIREIKPRWIVAENVLALTSPKFEKTFEFICSQMEIEGYEVQPVIIPASAVEADHERYRVWFIAYSKCIRLSGQGAYMGQMQPKKVNNRKTSRFIDFVQRNSLPYLCRNHNGVSRRVDEQSLQAIGNAIVPQIAFDIFKSINEFESNITK